MLDSITIKSPAFFGERFVRLAESVPKRPEAILAGYWGSVLKPLNKNTKLGANFTTVVKKCKTTKPNSFK